MPGRLCRGPQGEPLVQILSAEAPTWLAQLPSLLTREHREMLHREILGATRERMLREIGDALESFTAETPLLLVFEDLHWVDDSTVDLISALARRRHPETDVPRYLPAFVHALLAPPLGGAHAGPGGSAILS